MLSLWNKPRRSYKRSLESSPYDIFLQCFKNIIMFLKIPFLEFKRIFKFVCALNQCLVTRSAVNNFSKYGVFSFYCHLYFLSWLFIQGEINLQVFLILFAFWLIIFEICRRKIPSDELSYGLLVCCGVQSLWPPALWSQKCGHQTIHG